jgi:hypothetical protein
MGLADIVHSTGFQVTAHARGLHVDDRAGAERDRRRDAAGGDDGFVETDRGTQTAGERGVAEEVVVSEGLLEKEKIEVVEGAEVSGVA